MEVKVTIIIEDPKTGKILLSSTQITDLSSSVFDASKLAAPRLDPLNRLKAHQLLQEEPRNTRFKSTDFPDVVSHASIWFRANGMNTPIANALAQAEVTPAKLFRISSEQLILLRNIGPTAIEYLAEFKRKMETQGPEMNLYSKEDFQREKEKKNKK